MVILSSFTFERKRTSGKVCLCMCACMLVCARAHMVTWSHHFETIMLDWCMFHAHDISRHASTHCQYTDSIFLPVWVKFITLWILIQCITTRSRW